MRLSALLLPALLTYSFSAGALERNPWARLAAPGQKPLHANASNAVLSASQRLSVARLLQSQAPPDGCNAEDPWLGNLRYRYLPLSRSIKVLLVEDGDGCARGGQGSNGAMWLLRLDGQTMRLLASPKEKLEGYLLSVEPTTSNGYRDVILGWHVSAGETAVAYFRFDGRAYRRVGIATLTRDEAGKPRITPE